MRLLLAPFALASLAACATGSPVGGRMAFEASRSRPFGPPSAPRSVPGASNAGTPVLEGRGQVVELAKSLVGKSAVVIAGKRYPDDCTGLVSGLFEQLGVDLFTDAQPGDNGVTAIYRYVSHRGRLFHDGRPTAGDLVFFNETYDVNRDSRRNDGLTHIGMVESVDEEGTVQVIHRVGRGVVRYRMNLGHRLIHRDAGGRTLNDYLRSPGPGQGPVLTSQLFFAFGSLLVPDEQLARR